MTWLSPGDRCLPLDLQPVFGLPVRVPGSSRGRVAVFEARERVGMQPGLESAP